MKMKTNLYSITIALSLALGLVSPVGAAAQTNHVTANQSSGGTSLDSSYNVVAGDVLGITVAGEEKLTSEYTVSPEGKINLWLLGEVAAGSRTPPQIETNITQQLKADYIINPIVRVTVKTFKKRIVSVMGEVQKPGTVTFDGDHKLLLPEAISTAGGFTKIANRSKIYIVRKGKRIEFDYKAYERNPDSYPVSAVLDDKDYVDVQQSTF